MMVGRCIRGWQGRGVSSRGILIAFSLSEMASWSARGKGWQNPQSFDLVLSQDVEYFFESVTHDGYPIIRHRIPIGIDRYCSALNHYLDWPNLGQVCCLERTRTRKGVKSVETSYGVTSLNPDETDPARLLRLRRGHWGIENQVHWVRDVTFDEDRSQVRTGAAPQVMAAPRNLVTGLVRRTGATNVAAALPHYG